MRKPTCRHWVRHRRTMPEQHDKNALQEEPPWAHATHWAPLMIISSSRRRSCWRSRPGCTHFRGRPRFCSPCRSCCCRPGLAGWRIVFPRRPSSSAQVAGGGRHAGRSLRHGHPALRLAGYGLLHGAELHPVQPCAQRRHSGIVPGGTYPRDQRSVQAATTGTILLGIALLAAVAGLIGTVFFVGRPGMDSANPFSWFGPLDSFLHLRAVRRDPALLLTLFGEAFFYFLSPLLVLTINNPGAAELGFSYTLPVRCPQLCWRASAEDRCWPRGARRRAGASYWFPQRWASACFWHA